MIVVDSVQASRIVELRAQGYGYKRVASALGLSEGTVKSWCHRHNLAQGDGDAVGGVDASAGADGGVVADAAPLAPVPVFCPSCGSRVAQNRGRKAKRFCNDACRMKWWNTHPENVRHRSWRAYRCAECGREFRASGRMARRYCSRACYTKARREQRNGNGGGAHDDE